MLEEVHIDLFLGDLDVRLNVVGEYLHLEGNTLLGQHRLHLFKDFGVRNGGRRDAQRGFGVRREGGEGKRRGNEGDKSDFHRFFLYGD